jgi:hypothetical protein
MIFERATTIGSIRAIFIRHCCLRLLAAWRARQGLRNAAGMSSRKAGLVLTISNCSGFRSEFSVLDRGWKGTIRVETGAVRVGAKRHKELQRLLNEVSFHRFLNAENSWICFTCESLISISDYPGGGHTNSNF